MDRRQCQSGYIIRPASSGFAFEEVIFNFNEDGSFRLAASGQRFATWPRSVKYAERQTDAERPVIEVDDFDKPEIWLEDNSKQEEQTVTKESAKPGEVEAEEEEQFDGDQKTVENEEDIDHLDENDGKSAVAVGAAATGDSTVVDLETTQYTESGENTTSDSEEIGVEQNRDETENDQTQIDEDPFTKFIFGDHGDPVVAKSGTKFRARLVNIRSEKSIAPVRTVSGAEVRVDEVLFCPHWIVATELGSNDIILGLKAFDSENYLVMVLTSQTSIVDRVHHSRDRLVLREFSDVRFNGSTRRGTFRLIPHDVLKGAFKLRLKRVGKYLKCEATEIDLVAEKDASVFVFVNNFLSQIN